MDIIKEMKKQMLVLQHTLMITTLLFAKKCMIILCDILQIHSSLIILTL